MFAEVDVAKLDTKRANGVQRTFAFEKSFQDAAADTALFTVWKSLGHPYGIFIGHELLFLSNG